MRIYRAAVICERFPAYRFEDIDTAPAADLLVGIKLLNVAERVRNA